MAEERGDWDDIKMRKGKEKAKAKAVAGYVQREKDEWVMEFKYYCLYFFFQFLFWVALVLIEIYFFNFFFGGLVDNVIPSWRFGLICKQDSYREVK